MSPEWTDGNWRRRPDLNRGWRFCRPLPYHLATAPVGISCAREFRPRPQARRQQRRATIVVIVRVRLTSAVHLRGFTASVDNLRLFPGSSLACQPKLARVSGERRLERETGFEPATSTLARSHSTTELFPLTQKPSSYHSGADQTTAGDTPAAIASASPLCDTPPCNRSASSREDAWNPRVRCRKTPRTTAERRSSPP